MVSYSEIDTRVQPLYTYLEANGVPVNQLRLREARIQWTVKLAREQEQLNRVMGREIDLLRQTDRDQAIAVTSAAQVHQVKVLKKRVQQTNLLQSVCEHNQTVSGFFGVFPQYRRLDTGWKTMGGAGHPFSWDREMRVFLSMSGHLILRVCYCGLELRTLAILSGDPVLCTDLRESFSKKGAQYLFETNDPSPDQQKIVRYISLSLIYSSERSREWVVRELEGLSGRSQAELLSDLDRYTHYWNQRYPVLSNWQDQIHNSDSYQNCFGRYLQPEPHRGSSSWGRRAAMHSTMADLTDLGWATVWEDPRVWLLGVRPVLAIHDALVVLVPRNVDCETLVQILREDLEGIDPDLPVNLPVRIEFGNSWGDLL